jgi:hypothetical protein
MHDLEDSSADRAKLNTIIAPLLWSLFSSISITHSFAGVRQFESATFVPAWNLRSEVIDHIVDIDIQFQTHQAVKLDFAG